MASIYQVENAREVEIFNYEEEKLGGDVRELANGCLGARYCGHH